jgi:5-methylcytosine-specific restriction endonuclease McrA
MRRQADPSRRSSIRRLYRSARWSAMRRAHLKRPGNRTCRDCIAEGKPPALCIPVRAVIDHDPPHDGTEATFFDRSRLVTLCGRHHSRRTAMFDGGFGNVKRPRQPGGDGMLSIDADCKVKK